jgi:hypothetical protein
MDGHASLAGAGPLPGAAKKGTAGRDLPSSEVDALIAFTRAVGLPADLVSGEDLQGWGALTQHRNPCICLDMNGEPLEWHDDALLFLCLAESRLSGVLPDIFDVFSNLIVLMLASNALTGCLPTHWPVSLKVLLVNDNPELAGVITKDLIVQCDSIVYTGCKQRWECTKEQQMAGTGWMQGPFIVGVTFASENIGCLLEQRDECSITYDMLKDAPPKSDNQYSMYATHGKQWCAWQEVWLTGLRSLRNRKVFIMVGDGEAMTEEQEVEKLRSSCEEEAEGEDWRGEFDRQREKTLHRRDGRPWEPKDKGQFKRKFLRKSTDEENTQNCFDPRYELAQGECAHSILDWERRHMLHVATENNLKVVYLDADDVKLVVRDQPAWYVAVVEDVTELTSMFAAMQNTATA